METTLRPLTLGEILDRTAEIYRSNFLLLTGISSVYGGILLVLSLLQIGSQQAAKAMHLNTVLIVVSIVGLVILYLAVFVAGGLAIAANTRAVGWLHLGEPASIGAAYRAILPNKWRYLWLMTIAYFRAWFPCVLLYAAYAAFLVVYVRPTGIFSATPPATPPDSGKMIVILMTSLAFIFLVFGALIFGIIMSLRYALAIPASAVENLKARDAIRRSIQLSKGSRGQIFMLGLLALVIQLGLTGITQGFFVVVGIKHHGVIPVWMSVVQQFLAFLTNTFVHPIYATGFTLFYYDQRVRKEGFDIEHMMQSAGLAQPSPVVDIAAPEIAVPDPGSAHE